jgi:hypothetical protein
MMKRLLLQKLQPKELRKQKPKKLAQGKKVQLFRKILKLLKDR